MWSISSWLYCSLPDVFNACKHLFALVNLILTWLLDFESPWKINPNRGRSFNWATPQWVHTTSSLFSFLKISSLLLLALDYTTCGYLWTMLKIDFNTSSGDVLWLYQTGATNVESYAYLNKTGSELCSISKSLRKILNKYDPLTLSWVVPLWIVINVCFPRIKTKTPKTQRRFCSVSINVLK